MTNLLLNKQQLHYKVKIQHFNSTIYEINANIPYK